MPGSPEPQRRLLRTSDALSWRDVGVERRSHDGGDWWTPALPIHMVCLYVGAPMLLAQDRDGHRRSDGIDAGDLQIVPAGSESTWRHTETAEFISLQFSRELVGRVCDETAGSPSLIDRFCVRDMQIEMLGRELDRELTGGAQNGSLYAEHLAAAIVALLAARHGTRRGSLVVRHKGLPARTLQKLLNYIDVHLTTQLTLPELAAVSGLRVSHFSATFRRSTGCSPHEYVIRKRVALARRLLIQGDLPIADVATAAGFYDQSHLSRHMRRLLGMSPRDVRRSSS